MPDVVDLSKHRPPVTYTVTITQHWDGRMEAFVQDVADDERSRDAVIDALARLLQQMRDKRVGHAGDAMLAQMLALIDSAMHTTTENLAVLRISPDELAAWAEAVAEYERVRFPTA